mmetsp:Transcript_52385/g.132407  ORF Transcript_52385/g.132407 Transcript_52385/m.132407 type:complete len:305 (-) Transcript_52385:203-1117(-)|eukprot:CAMPEP_0115251894 /NCGR_PEP_ID=MMETSP0270-20121206/43869_1 /TAXON_ID=71861 /ORGANISM="Scrippsiella trochoidea, Strain CCMP3099" /LENGTH=304 /DNA_ID=CAMNT_0002667337 /DNA_START=77 /DNA_END=991 /DNA_ORIENTATION=-
MLRSLQEIIEHGKDKICDKIWQEVFCGNFLIESVFGFLVFFALTHHWPLGVSLLTLAIVATAIRKKNELPPFAISLLQVPPCIGCSLLVLQVMILLLFGDMDYSKVESWKDAGVTTLASSVWAMAGSSVTSIYSSISRRAERARCRFPQLMMFLCWFSCVVFQEIVVLVLNVLQVLKHALAMIVPIAAPILLMGLGASMSILFILFLGYMFDGQERQRPEGRRRPEERWGQEEKRRPEDPAFDQAVGTMCQVLFAVVAFALMAWFLWALRQQMADTERFGVRHVEQYLGSCNGLKPKQMCDMEP